MNNFTIKDKISIEKKEPILMLNASPIPKEYERRKILYEHPELARLRIKLKELVSERFHSRSKGLEKGYDIEIEKVNQEISDYEYINNIKSTNEI